ncbi:MAG TPA: hypothetical protein VH877_24435 [Polyangia bacterium]|jgi:hypothetical protein|nr:hypothetical protein [Polyangia bacterium]
MNKRENEMQSETASGSARGEDAGPAGAGKRAWQTPALTYIGDLEDLVQGGGKRGSFIDGDPRSSRKGGGG